MRVHLSALLVLAVACFHEIGTAQVAEPIESQERPLIRPMALLDSCSMPEFPEMPSEDAPTAGKVTVLVSLDTLGNVVEATTLIESPEGFGFADAVQKVITGWKFTPATWAGRAVVYGHPVTFLFKDGKVEMVETERSHRAPPAVSTEPKEQE